MKTFLVLLFVTSLVVQSYALPTEEHSQPRKKFEISPKELVNIDGTYYYITPGNLIYTAVDALMICNDINMRILSLETEEKALPIYKYLNENGHNKTFWLSGISYSLNKSLKHVFLWSGSGAGFTYTNWQAGQPNESTSKVDVCVFMDVERRWIDADCASVIAVICEY